MSSDEASGEQRRYELARAGELARELVELVVDDEVMSFVDTANALSHDDAVRVVAVLAVAHVQALRQVEMPDELIKDRTDLVADATLGGYFRGLDVEPDSDDGP